MQRFKHVISSEKPVSANSKPYVRRLRIEHLESREMLSAVPLGVDPESFVSNNGVVSCGDEAIDFIPPIELAVLNVSEHLEDDSVPYEVESEESLDSFLDNLYRSRLIVDGEELVPLTFAPRPEKLIFSDQTSEIHDAVEPFC